MTKKAFTLAEALVALVVIGVVAVMVVPIMKTTILEKEFMVTAKKAFANISQDYKIAMDSAQTDLKGIKTDRDLAIFYAQFLPVLSGVKESPGDIGGYGFSTIDGAYYSFHVDEEGCGGGYADKDGKFYRKSKCYVVVDTNGLDKLPNTDSAVVDSKFKISDRVTFLITDEAIKPNCVSYYIANNHAKVEDFSCGEPE